MQQLLLKLKGLYTLPSDLSGASPDGALSVADNIVIDAEDVASPRRGFNQAAVSGGVPAKLYVYQNQLIQHDGTNTLKYYSNNNTDTFSTDSGATWTTISGTYPQISSTAKVHFAEAKQNLYFTTGSGVYKMDAYTSTPKLSGAFKGLDVQSSIVSATGNWLANGYRTAYRVVWGYKDLNKNLILGTPSQIEAITNSTGSTASVQLSISIPAGVTTAWFYQVYRAAAQAGGVEPDDEMSLVYESNPSAGDITAKSVTVTDITPDTLRGAILYTSATQEGLAAGNEQPPMAQDIAVFKNTTFYGNTTSKNRQIVTLLAVGGTNGLAVNNTITVGGITYTAKTSETTASAQFRAYLAGTFNFTVTIASPAVVTAAAHGLSNGDPVILSTTGALPTGLALGTTYYVISAATNTFQLAATYGGTAINTSGSQSGTHTVTYGGSAAQNIRDTALSLVRTINRYASSTVYAYYLSGPSDLPGKILIEERGIGGAAFTTASSNTSSWSPSLASAVTSTNDRFKNGLYYSKNSQPESVPLANYFFVGSADKNILRILPLRDSLFVLKDDGIYRVSGEAGSFRVDLLDSTTHLLAPETAVVLNNQIFALTDQGVAAISEGGVQVRSRAIENTLLSLQGVNPSILQTGSFGISYETERKYLLFLPKLAGDTSPTQAFVFNTFTNTWTRWVLNKTCGLVNAFDNKLYLGDAVSGYVNQERKSYSYLDYVDYRRQITITAVASNVLSVTNSDQINVGDVIYQTNAIYSTVASVDTTAGTVVTDFVAQFTTTTASLLAAIPSTIKWIPITGGNPGSLKHFREVTMLFKSDFTGSGTLEFTSDTSPAIESDVVTGTAVGVWGLFAWGSAPWGGTNYRRPIRLYIPRNKRRSSQISIQFHHSTGFGNYQLNGLSIIANPGTERVAT